jgi:hypothetical protein
MEVQAELDPNIESQLRAEGFSPAEVDLYRRIVSRPDMLGEVACELIGIIKDFPDMEHQIMLYQGLLDACTQVVPLSLNPCDPA